MKKIKGVRVEKLTRAMMRRSMRLLDMEYKPSEIADELAVTKAQVMRLITAGAPARKDAGGHLWIHGLTLVDWMTNAAPKKPRDKTIFQDDEAYCMGCRSVVKYTETSRRKMMSFGLCPHGHKVTRFLSSKSLGKKGKKHHEEAIATD